jgi:hypothetical protein
MSDDSATITPPSFFSTLYYNNQEGRNKLPSTDEEILELQKSITDYEGKRYDQIPEWAMSDEMDSKEKFGEIEEYRKSHVEEEDIRFFRKHLLEHKDNDYDYRYWLQYGVEEMSAGNRSMRILTERDREEEKATDELYRLTQKLSTSIYKFTKGSRLKGESTKKAFAKIFKWNNEIAKDEDHLSLLFDKNIPENSIKLLQSENRWAEIKSQPLFWLIARETWIAYFQTINEIENLKPIGCLKDQLAKINIADHESLTNKELKRSIWDELNKPKNNRYLRDFTNVSFVCAGNQLFSKLQRRLLKKIGNWSYFYNNCPQFEPNLMKRLESGETLTPEEFLKMPLDEYKDFREMSIKITTICFAILHGEGFVSLDMAKFEELDALYVEEYKSSNSRPNVFRMRKSLLEELNNGDHAIIRHFQEDIKRSMYCLPKNHRDNSGGFLINGRTVSQPAALRDLIRTKQLPSPRFEPSETTLDTLNILQRTQWSINLDFLHFIVDIKFDGKTIDPCPKDIRHLSWADSDNMALKEVFVEKMGLHENDRSTKSRLRTINSILSQARKNLMNSGNVFWHSWFCDWRGRFNTRIKDISPQGGDLSKALLLFCEWKTIGEKGKFWIYVRAYDLLFKNDLFQNDNVINKAHKFQEKVEWVEENKSHIIDIGKKLRSNQLDDNENSRLLGRPGIKKAKGKSEMFQRIAFLFEFTRIHIELENNGGDWESVKSGIPIHFDASCNGFQHIAALTRNEKLAHSVNLLNDTEGKKGDLYQEVADYAKDNVMINESSEAKEMKKILEKICDSDEENMKHMIDNLFVRDLSKPLVMVIGYGAKKIESQISDRNGKRPGYFVKESNDEKWGRTLHPESTLSIILEKFRDKPEFHKLFIDPCPKRGFVPIEKCELLAELGKKIAKYIRWCINKVTNDSFQEVENKLKQIYKLIETKDGNEINQLNFKWRINKQSSLIRNVRWELKSAHSKVILSPFLLPSDYQNPSEEEIIKWLKNSETLDNAMKYRLEERNNKYKKYLSEKNPIKGTGEAESSYPYRKLKEQVHACLEYVIRLSSDVDVYDNLTVNSDDTDSIKEKKFATQYLLSRWLPGKKGFKILLKPKMDIDTFKNGKKKPEVLNRIANDIIRGLVPNYIHSFDALHMQMVIQELNKSGIEDIWAVHDSFGVHACHADDMREIVRKTFIELHRDPLPKHINRIIKLNSDILNLKGVEEQVISKPSKDWINDVINSEYMIS